MPHRNLRTTSHDLSIAREVENMSSYYKQHPPYYDQFFVSSIGEGNFEVLGELLNKKGEIRKKRNKSYRFWVFLIIVPNMGYEEDWERVDLSSEIKRRGKKEILTISGEAQTSSRNIVTRPGTTETYEFSVSYELETEEFDPYYDYKMDDNSEFDPYHDYKSDYRAWVLKDGEVGVRVDD